MADALFVTFAVVFIGTRIFLFPKYCLGVALYDSSSNQDHPVPFLSDQYFPNDFLEVSFPLRPFLTGSYRYGSVFEGGPVPYWHICCALLVLLYCLFLFWSSLVHPSLENDLLV